MEWDKVLCFFEKIFYDNILRILNISYESLDEFSKIVFFYVVCFFNGEFVLCVKFFFYCGEDGIWVLVEKFFIDLFINGCIVMYYLLEKMGRWNELGNDFFL